MTDRATIITKAVADECGLSLQQINLITHQRQFARPRQIAMTLQREIMGERSSGSLPAIAQRFAGSRWNGRMHHTSVLWATKRVKDLRAKDAGFDAVYRRCEQRAMCALLEAGVREAELMAKAKALQERERRVTEYFDEPITRVRPQVSSGRSAA